MVSLHDDFRMQKRQTMTTGTHAALHASPRALERTRPFSTLVALLALASLPVRAQGRIGQVQLIEDQLAPGEHNAYLLRGLKPGGRITIHAR